MKTLKQQRFEKKLSKACNELVAHYDKNSERFKSKSKAYKSSFLRIVKSTVLPLADIGEDFVRTSDESDGADWTQQAFEGSFLHASTILNGGQFCMNEKEKNELITELTKNTIRIAKQTALTRLTKPEQETFFQQAEKYIFDYALKNFDQIYAIYYQLTSEHSTNKWLNITMFRVYLMALNKFTN